MARPELPHRNHLVEHPLGCLADKKCFLQVKKPRECKGYYFFWSFGLAARNIQRGTRMVRRLVPRHDAVYIHSVG